MKSSTIALLPLLTIAAACGGSGSGTADPSTPAAPAASQSTTPLDEIDILNKVYDNNYSVPDGFFVDERAETTTRSYSVHHVLDASSSYEVCTDDLVIAQNWEAADNAARAVNGYYVTSHENDRYFEFVRELDYDNAVGNITEPTSPGFARVFKCSYANRDGVDRSLLDGYSGKLDNLAADPLKIREFVEYLWQFRFFNVSRKVVLQSASGGAQEHTLQLAFLVNQGVNQCDRIDVIEWQFSAENDNGDIHKHFETVHSFEADSKNGSPELCK